MVVLFVVSKTTPVEHRQAGFSAKANLMKADAITSHQGIPWMDQAFRALIDAVPAMVWVGDDQGRVRYFNEQYYAFSGLPREDDDGFSYLGVIHPDDMFKHELGLARVKAHQIVDFEIRLRNAAGSYRWFIVRGVPFTTADGQVMYIGTNTDIDDRKRAEEVLIKNEEEFRMLAELIPQLVSVTDLQGRVHYANQRYYDLTGLRREDEDGYSWQKAMHPDDLKVVLPQLDEPPIAPGSLWTMELRYRTASGSYRWHLVRAVRTGGDNSKVFATATDIHEQKQAAEEVKESEAHFKTLAEVIPQIVWTATADGDITFFNQRWFEYTRLTVEQSISGGWQLLLHPDDLPIYLDEWQKCLATGDTFECTFRLKRAVGVRARRANEYRKHLCRAVALRSSSGHIIQWFGTWTDVGAAR